HPEVAEGFAAEVDPGGVEDRAPLARALFGKSDREVVHAEAVALPQDAACGAAEARAPAEDGVVGGARDPLRDEAIGRVFDAREDRVLLAAHFVTSAMMRSI